MAPILEPLVPITVRALVIPLGLLLTYLIARGLIGMAEQIVRALFGSVSGAVGWIPWLGGKAKGKISDIRDRLINYLAHAASFSEHKIGESFHALAALVKSVGDAIYGASVATYNLGQWLHKVVGVQTFKPAIHNLFTHQKATALTAKATKAQAAADHKAIAHPDTGRIGAAIKHGTKGIDAGLKRLEHATLPRLRTLEHDVSVVIPGDIAGLRARDLSLGRLYHGVRSRLERLDHTTVGIGAAALVITALGRIGAGWIRCRNVRTLGRRLCGMNPSTLEDLLGLTLAVVGTISIIEFAEELQAVVGEVADDVHRLIRDK